MLTVVGCEKNGSVGDETDIIEKNARIIVMNKW